MNDPDVAEPIQEAAQDVEGNVFTQDEKDAIEEEEDYLDPGRWWFASTACPLIAGTFGPMANAFSICALVENWRVHIPPGKDEGHAENIKDPKWLLAINSVSLVFALVANMSLLLNMARRLTFAIAQPITIVGWFLSSFLLIALVAVASSSIFRLRPAEQHALTQAYYYGIIAAGLYCIISILMIFTVAGAYRGHYPKEFRLTAPQRTLMLQTIGFVVYLLLGALVFSKVEGWPYLDAVYWADFTLLTVGIGGEYVPKTHTGRSLLFPYAIGGVTMVGLVVGSVRSLVLERGKQKMSARFVEMTRQKVLSSMDKEERTLKIGWFERVRFSGRGLTETEKREQEFRIMRKVQDKAERNRRYSSLALSTIAALALWFFGALVFMKAEKPQGWSYFVSMYFSYTSLLTIGYGDYTLSSNSSKPFFVFWSLLAVPTLTILISNMGDTVIKSFKSFTEWIGSFTVLPDEHSFEAALKLGIRRINIARFYRADPAADYQDRNTNNTMSRLAEHVEDDELKEAEEAGEHGDLLERDIHFYHFILARELRQLMLDVEVSPPKQYTYQEWTYFLRLLGQDEANPSLHRQPKIQHSHKNKGPDLGVADGGKEQDDTPYAWSWLGIRSPLMGNNTEARWLLKRVSAQLEREMQKMRSGKKERPPISMEELKQGPEGSGSDAGELLEKEIGAAEVRRRQQNRTGR